MKRSRVRTPTRNVIREKKGKDSFASCSACGQPMHGMPVRLHGISATGKKPTRAYGGNMCASCSKEFFRQRARSI